MFSIVNKQILLTTIKLTDVILNYTKLKKKKSNSYIKVIFLWI